MVIDVDGVFEKYLRRIMKEQAGKYTEEQWEDRMAALYVEFGNTPAKELGGKTPARYFGEMSTQTVVATLKEYVLADVSVPDFLCDAIIAAKGADEYLVKLLNEDDEELVSYAVNLLSDRGYTGAFSKYLDMIENKNVDDEMKDLVTEILLDGASTVKEQVLVRYPKANATAKAYFLEILVAAGKDDRTFEILKAAFGQGEENIPLFAAYFARLGDDRALPLLLEVVKRPDLNYQEYQELKFAIEALGGEYEDKRDFTKDKIYRKIQAQRKREEEQAGKE